MNNTAIVLLALTMFIVIATLSSLLVFNILKKLRQQSDKPLSQDMTGVILVPVRKLKQAGFFSSSANGIFPRLEITPDGLRFKIFNPDYWPFDEISEVDALRVPFVTRLAIKNLSGNCLYIDLADRAKARDFLQSLPKQLHFKPRAIAMRDVLV